MDSMSKTRLILIRHGETQWNREKRLMGISDIALTETGKLQAKAAGIYLKDYPIDIFYSSPLKRTRQTAESIRKHHQDSPIIYHNHLMERSFGILEGALYQESVTRFAMMDYDACWQFPMFRPPGGERLHDVSLRVKKFLKELYLNHKGKTSAIVSHGITLRIIIRESMSLPYRDLGFSLANTSITLLEGTPGHMRMHFLNHSADSGK
jgi:broad specificity phosphatase PhoE